MAAEGVEIAGETAGNPSIAGIVKTSRKTGISLKTEKNPLTSQWRAM
jgi:hypothetical protein